jgi:manganese transport protein
MSAISTPSASAAIGRSQPLRRLGGAGLLVAVGYMDPGNWATDIAGGSSYRYALIPVVIGASLLGLLLQNLAARVAVATGQDLAQLTARYLPRPLARSAWLAGEVAILATALAELIGGAIALQLLFGLAFGAGLAIAALGTLAVMAWSQRHQDFHEKLVNLLVGVVALSFLLLVFHARPSGAQALHDVVHSGGLLRQREALLLALGIVGATVMPHNLYLHSGLVAERVRGIAPAQRFAALRQLGSDTFWSLLLASLVNVAILAVAAASLSGRPISSLAEAHSALGMQLGAGAALIFAVALYASGQSSAVTGVIAGGLLTRGFRGRAGSAWLRGIVTRLGATALACLLLAWRGAGSPDSLLVITQVVLSLALPFALLPLARLASRREVMGELVLPRAARVAMLAVSAALTLLDLGLLALQFAG